MYILDTCALIWMLSDVNALSEKAKFAIISSEKAFVSLSSLWEIAIKQGNGKINLKKSISDIAKVCKDSNIEIIYPTPDELDIVQNLPKIHGDPFDRLIIAQALNRNLTILTSDHYISQYDIVHTLW